MENSPRVVSISEALLQPLMAGIVRVGLLIPLSGPMGISGAGMLASAQLAAGEARDRLGVEVELVLIDAGQGTGGTCTQVEEAIQFAHIRCLVGTHPSDVRAPVSRTVRGRVPYVYTPPREFGESDRHTVFLGLSPQRQLLHAIRWVMADSTIKKWSFIGDRYIWPDQVHRTARGIVQELGGEVVYEMLVPFGHMDVRGAVESIQRSNPHAILLALIGADLSDFLRYTRTHGALQSIMKLSPGLEENVLVRAGGDSSGDLLAVMPSFVGQSTETHAAFLESYTNAYGVYSPYPSAYSESTYTGVHLAISMCAENRTGRSPADGNFDYLVDGRNYGAWSLPVENLQQTMSLGLADGFGFHVIHEEAHSWQP